jgi:hypothetical protein
MTLTLREQLVCAIYPAVLVRYRGESAQRTSLRSAKLAVQFADQVIQELNRPTAGPGNIADSPPVHPPHAFRPLPPIDKFPPDNASGGKVPDQAKKK